MAGKGTSTLRARIELVGGKKVVDEFDKIKRGSKGAFDSIDREAKEATRDIKELERELAKLEAMSKAIRADIKVKKGGSLSDEQQAALAVAKQLDQNAAAIRNQIRGVNDSLKLGGGDVLKTWAGAADQDFLKVAEGADALDASIGKLRENGGLGGIIKDSQLDELAEISKNLRKEDQLFKGGLQQRVTNASEADAAKERRAAENERKDNERFTKRQNAIEAAHARKRELDDVREKDRAKQREEAQTAYLAKLDERLTRQKEQNELHIQKVRSESHRREMLHAQRRRDQLQAQSRIDIARQVARDQREARAARFAPHVPASGAAEKVADVDARGRGLGGLIGDLNVAPKLGAASKAMREWINSADGLGKVGRAFTADGKLISRVAGQISRSLNSSVGGISKFVSAMGGLSSAVGSAALRTGVAGLLSALGIGLAALGGAAVLGGIAAIAALAGFDATRIANAAKTVGSSLEAFSAMRYAAQSSGVLFEDYTEGLTALQKAMVGIVSKSEDFENAGKLMERYGVNILSPDGTDLKDTSQLLKELSDAYNKLPNQTLKLAFLDEIAGKDGAEAMRKLIPILEQGSDKLTQLEKEAAEIGIVLDPKMIEDFKLLNAELFKIWNIFRGIGYAVAREVLPHLKPVMDQINAFLIANKGNIATGLTDAFNYLVQVTKDLWALWNDENAKVSVQWTKTFADGMRAVGDVASWVWDKISNGYELVEPSLTKLGEVLGTGGPLSTALLILGAWVLGFFGVFTAGGKAAVAALGLVSGFITQTLLPSVLGVLGYIAGIIGWPVLLVAGVAAVIGYWDEIGEITEKAWLRFKELFPQTAAVLEKAFGPALEVVKKWWTDFKAQFAANYPDLKGTIDGIGEAFRGIVDILKELDWGMILNGLGNGVLLTLNGLLTTLDAIARAIGYIGSFAGLWDAPGDDGLTAEKEMFKTDRRQWEALDKMLREGGGSSRLYSFAASMGMTPEAVVYGFSTPVSPTSGASASSGGVVPAAPQMSGTPIAIQIDSGPTVIAYTNQPDAAAALAARARAKVSAR